MLKKSFLLIFIEPLKNTHRAIKEYVIFLFKLIFDTLLIRDFKDLSEDDRLSEVAKLFYFFLFVIIGNIAYNEAFLDLDSDFTNELFAEIFFSIFYYIFVIIIYYFGKLSNIILKSTILESIATKLFNFYSLILVIILQFSGVFSHNGLESTNIVSVYTWIGLCVFIAIHLAVVYIVLFNRNIFTKRHLLFNISLYIVLILVTFFFTLISQVLVQ